MHITPPAHYPLRHQVDRVIHAQLWVFLDHYLCQYEFQTAGAEAIDVPMLAASVSGERAFTLARYAHVLPGMQEKAAAKLEAILFGR